MIFDKSLFVVYYYLSVISHSLSNSSLSFSTEPNPGIWWYSYHRWFPVRSWTRCSSADSERFKQPLYEHPKSGATNGLLSFFLKLIVHYNVSMLLFLDSRVSLNAVSFRCMCHKCWNWLKCHKWTLTFSWVPSDFWQTSQSQTNTNICWNNQSLFYCLCSLWAVKHCRFVNDFTVPYISMMIQNNNNVILGIDLKK